MQEKVNVVLTFDDGREDNYEVFMQILRSRGLPASIYIATGYVNGECGCGGGQTSKPLTVSQIQQLNQCELFEVAAHSNSHCNDLNDIQVGKEILQDWINQAHESKIGFASPGSMMSDKYVKENMSKLNRMGLDYVRTGSNFQALKHGKDVGLFRRIAKRIWKSNNNNKYLYLAAYGDSFVKNNDNDASVFTSFPVLHRTTLESLKLVVKKAIKRKYSAIFMFHSIKKVGDIDYENMWSWDYNDFVKFCDYLCQMREKQIIEIICLKDLKNLER